MGDRRCPLGTVSPLGNTATCNVRDGGTVATAESVGAPCKALIAGRGSHVRGAAGSAFAPHRGGDGGDAARCDAVRRCGAGVMQMRCGNA